MWIDWKISFKQLLGSRVAHHPPVHDVLTCLGKTKSDQVFFHVPFLFLVQALIDYLL